MLQCWFAANLLRHVFAVIMFINWQKHLTVCFRVHNSLMLWMNYWWVKITRLREAELQDLLPFFCNTLYDKLKRSDYVSYRFICAQCDKSVAWLVAKWCWFNRRLAAIAQRAFSFCCVQCWLSCVFWRGRWRTMRGSWRRAANGSCWRWSSIVSASASSRCSSSSHHLSSSDASSSSSALRASASARLSNVPLSCAAAHLTR